MGNWIQYVLTGILIAIAINSPTGFNIALAVGAVVFDIFIVARRRL